MKKMKKALALVLALGIAASLTACGQKGQGTTDDGASDFPNKDITIVVPFDAGGGNDIVARLIAKVAMEGGYFNGANVIVENQPGGGGAIGQGYVAKTADADGYTLLAYTASVITNTLLKDVPFTVDDLKVIVCCNSDPAVMIARPDAPFDDVEGLLEYAKENTLLVNDSGFATSSHIRTLDWTSKLEEITGETINYDCIHVDSGNVKAIGIMTDERFEGLPDVPTFKEMGYDGFLDGADRAIACSANVPDDVYNYLVEEFTKLCSSQEFIDAMNNANLTPACNSAEEYQVFIDGKVELITGLQDYLMAGEG